MAKRFQRLPPHFRPEYNTADIVRHRTTSVTQMSATKPKVETGSGQTFWTETDGEAIPTTWSKIWGLPLNSLRQLLPFKGYLYLRFPLPISRPTFQLPMSADAGQCGQCNIRVGDGRKYGGSRWNRFAICFRSKGLSTSGFHFRFRGRHLSYRCRSMSDNVGSVIFESGMVENVGVAVGIASPYISVQQLILLPVYCYSYYKTCNSTHSLVHAGRSVIYKTASKIMKIFTSF